METLMPDEQQMFLTQVNRLANQSLAELRLTREDPPREGGYAHWRRAAVEAGLLAATGDPGELMLWSPGMEQTSVQVLHEVARHDAGAALLLHRQAQGQCLARSLGCVDAPLPMLCLTGATGLGRVALAHWLRGGATDPEDDTELDSNWGVDAVRLFWSGEWQTGFAPVWQRGTFHWWRLNAGAHLRDRHAHAHAFEGLCVQSLSVDDGEALGAVSPGDFLALLMAEQLGLLAIGAGVLDQALEEACAYAGQRRQGGRLIRDWPAVQQLLADMRTTAESLEDCLALPWRRDLPGLARLMRRRATLSAATTGACHQAMQVFGGIGYMRDLGLERLVREANALRVMSGSPLFLPLLAEQLEEAR